MELAQGREPYPAVSQLQLVLRCEPRLGHAVASHLDAVLASQVPDPQTRQVADDFAVERAHCGVGNPDVGGFARSQLEAGQANLLALSTRRALSDIDLKGRLADDRGARGGHDQGRSLGLGLSHWRKAARRQGMRYDHPMCCAAAMIALSLSGNPANPYLARGVTQVQRLHEREAVRTLELARGWPDNTPEQLAQASLWLGLAYAGLNQPPKAKESFRAALVLDATLQLPAHASPRIQKWWEEAGGAPPTALTPPRPPPWAPVVNAAPALPPSAVLQPTVPREERPAPILAPEVRPVATPTASARHGSALGRGAGLGLGVAGLGAVGVGLFFGTRMSSLSTQARQETSVAPALALGTHARNAAQTANVFFVSGGLAAIAGGGVLALSW